MKDHQQSLTSMTPAPVVHQSASLGVGSPLTLFAESEKPSVVLGDTDGVKTMTIPHAADTTYLAHGYFRFIGKYPPQIVSWLMNRHPIKGTVVDSMCGGGTTLAEARLRGLDAVGIDVNPISRDVSTLVGSPLPVEPLDCEVFRFIDDLSKRAVSAGPLFRSKSTSKPLALRYCSEYFSDDVRQDIGEYLALVDTVPPELRVAFRVALFSVLRHVSRANIKKMNLEIDDDKRTIHPFFETVVDRLREIAARNREYSEWARPAEIRVLDGEAAVTGLGDESAGAVFLHPPYLTNTAFCEFTQLQLATLDIDHKTIWKKELRCRGTFLHESEGLKKYLIGWSRIINEAHRILRPGGLLVTVVGDGQIDYVRIPVGTITIDFARDCGFDHIESFLHVLNNHTGQTQSRKMKGQHVAVFKRRVS